MLIVSCSSRYWCLLLFVFSYVFFSFFFFLNVVPWSVERQIDWRGERWCKALFDHCILDLSNALQVSACNLMVSGIAIL